jgi:hypothetical protein
MEYKLQREQVIIFVSTNACFLIGALNDDIQTKSS